MTKENDSLDNSEDAVVFIGALEVPLWQFNIYFNESEKFLLELHKEVAAAKLSGVSKALVRDVHTLAGISNTLGAEAIARLGYALEDWLTNIFEERGSALLSAVEFALLETASAALTAMVERTRLKEPVLDERYDVLALLQEIDTQNHAKKMSASMDPEPKADGTPGDDDWFAKEMKSLEESLNFEVDPLAGWSIDTEPAAAPASKTLVLETKPIKAKAEPQPTAKKVETSPAPGISTGSTDSIITPSPALQEIRDFRDYVTDLLPSDDVQDAVEESIKEIFLEEATEIFDSLPDDIDAWSASRGHDNDKSNKIKRALHTLKGSSRMSGYFRFGAVVHNIETILETSHPVLTKEEIPDLVQAVGDVLMQEIKHLKNNAEPSGFIKSTKSAKVVAPAAKKVSPVQDTSTSAAKKKGPAASSVIRVEPATLQVKSSNTPEDANVNTVLRVPTEKIDLLSTQLGRSGTIQLRVETSVTKMNAQINEMSSNLERLRRLLKDVEIQAESQMKSRMEDAKRENASFDPLEFDRFTRLQELTRMSAEAMHDIDNSHSEVLHGLSHIQDSIAENNILAEDMQHAVMSVRTVPVKSLARRLEMVIRQASLDTKKQAGLFLDSNAEVDSGLLNKIVAPLEHLLRNSLAHGIEMPEARLSSGKPEKGVVTLQVRQKGNDTVFKLSDDGAGINRLAVENRAKQRGLISQDAVITQEQAHHLIFEAGFSTADTVSELAGRGVGMDVVSGIVSEMGGRIVVTSEEGKGTSFELIVPSYMSVISMVPVSAKGLDYAVPSALVRDVIVIRDTKVLEAYETGHLEINEVSYPFYGLSEASGADAPEIQRNNRVMLLDDQQGVAAIHIDGLQVDRNLVMKPLCRTIASLPGLLGATVAGDGSPLLVINPVQLRQGIAHNKRSVKANQPIADVVKTHADLTVMVIDDSMTIRRITQKFLARAGFKVVLAVDGLDAIEKIATHGAADLYLTDIEMPNMDGFQLTEHIRTSVSATTPIVMISSRSIEKYADHAKSLGVNRSLGKPYQEPELLSVIEELLGLKEISK